jgi:putative acetyltransferase
VHIVEASAADLENVLLVERLAFGEDEVAELVRELVDDPSARPLLSLLAWDGDRPVGHILFTAARLDGASRDVAISILAPLAVVPDAQRTGIGRSLIEQGIQQLSESGVELVFVLGHPDYYPRHGFEPAIRLGLMAQYPISPEEAWMVRALRPGVIGQERGTVVAADAMNRPEHWRE